MTHGATVLLLQVSSKEGPVGDFMESNSGQHGRLLASSVEREMGEVRAEEEEGDINNKQGSTLPGSRDTRGAQRVKVRVGHGHVASALHTAKLRLSLSCQSHPRGAQCSCLSQG